MQLHSEIKINTSFKKDILQGLSTYPKYLYSKYIYDKRGDRLFQDIMNMEEYYLTGAELEIFERHRQAISTYFKGNAKGFDLIELGAGDGKKTKILLEYLSENDCRFTYKPIDISENAVNDLTLSLNKEFPNVKVEPEIGEYFEVLERLNQYNDRKKVIMVLGSNIGNLLHPRAIEFLSELRESMQEDDLIFMGFDQKKDPNTILNAYNDPGGITAAFNKNLLVRINRELDGDFEVDKFDHWETYNPETGTAKSYLIAREAMRVTIAKLGLEVKFDQWETIHTEISQKYDDKVVQWLARESGLEILKTFTDSKGYYKDYCFRRKDV